MVDPQQQYAEVKRLFHEAVLLPDGERGRFLDQRCGPHQQDIRRGVETLLLHHDSRTILSVDEASLASPPGPIETRSLIPMARDGGGMEVSPQLVSELLRLLHTRLLALATVLTVVVVIAIIRCTLVPELPLRFTEFITLVSVFGSWAVLRYQRSLTAEQLRSLEIVLLVSICFQVLTNNVMDMMDAAAHPTAIELETIVDGISEADDAAAAAIVGADRWYHLAWCMIIMIYGVFVPNTWRRAAIVLLPLACVPYLVHWTMRWSIPVVDFVLELMEHRHVMPMPFVAACTAIYAARLLHKGTVEVHRAREFAQYRLGKRLGKGGMGEVYEAQHSLLKRDCAIKVILPGRQFDQATLAKFQREVQATARLTHPNTVEVFDYGQTLGGTFYYVMELLPGLSLGEIVTRHGPLPSARVCYLLRQVCGALQEAHEAGLVHRDLKPGNLFASQRGGVHDVAKVLDFGLVTSGGVDGAVASDGKRLMLGTPAFMPPEQGVRGGQVDARSDIYALGATAFYLLTGHCVFDEPTPEAQLLAHGATPPRRPSELGFEIPSDLEQIIMKCLEKNPRDRFASMLDLRDALFACECGEAWDDDQAARWWRERESHP